MDKKKVILVGNGKAALDALKIIQDQEYCSILSLVLIDTKNRLIYGADLKEYCESNNIPFLGSDNMNSLVTLDYISKIKPDLIFSVNNFQILRKPFLDLPQIGVINFHNSLLPRYAGLNACTWAIFNGEKEHGVTWHWMSQEVDMGDIIVQKEVPIEKSCTALQLVMTCIIEGMSLFEDSFEEILFKRTSIPQDLSKRLFYKKSQIPNNGLIDLTLPHDQIDRFFRSLNFHPLPNDIGYPKLKLNNRVYYIDKIKLLERSIVTKRGSIFISESNQVCFQSADAVGCFLKIRDENLKRIMIDQFIEENQLLEYKLTSQKLYSYQL